MQGILFIRVQGLGFFLGLDGFSLNRLGYDLDWGSRVGLGLRDRIAMH